MNVSYTRREALNRMAVLGALGLLGGRAGEAEAPKQPPNILFVMSDDHAAHAIGCYGSRVNQTPNIDRIAKEGIRFEHCLCSNAVCGPSRAVILTGKYSHLNGVRTNRDRFDGSQQTFPKLLQKTGYTTAVIGKWHLASPPTGFDYWNILPGQGDYVDPMMIEMGEKKKQQGYVTDLIADCTMDFIRKRDKTRPFCVMCHNKAPHWNWIPDAKHAELYKEPIPVPETFDDDYQGRSPAAAHAKIRVARDLKPQDMKEKPPSELKGEALARWKYQRYMEDYLRVVASVDDNMGRLLDFLDAEGLRDNTLVIYTSDQGFFLGDHGWFDKRFMYEESLRMPLVARWPGVIEPNTVNEDLVSNVDFAPTFLECAGVDAPKDMQGRSMMPVLKGKHPTDWRKTFYYEYFEYPAGTSVYPHYGVCTKKHKLIHYLYNDEIDAWELFDLEKDPHELHSVYDDPAYAGTVEELKVELARLRKELKVTE